MITQDNLPQVLALLGFEQRGTVFSKTIGLAAIEVDTAQQAISYPAGIGINSRTTCNFSAHENFVVLECVHRLLEKGYLPQHIELEPTWQLGRGASGGRADVLVKDNDGKPLLIIECKTPGAEFNSAWAKTWLNGDQLFSYAQQISATQFLCLYSSDLSDGRLTYSSHIISHRDNDEYLQENPDLKGFAAASSFEERYAIWRDTYQRDFATQGLFEDNIQPYHIGKDKYSLADLRAISAELQQKKYHEFATILRQHNVSGRENAFDKLVNLFLCKLVDEIENPNDLKFYWKGVAYDTHFDLLDRLQQLYKTGMGKFLGEEITYINREQVLDAMRFIRKDMDATQRAVWGLFTEQKFFTNNDFSFINVHNRKLFFQNAEVLLKVLQMWQDIRLTGSEGHNQFLGDMFEGFLDQGIKQSEGQYFTPMPICRFIMMSLPLESLVREQAVPPKAMDYACGAGHFLNELALQLKPLVTQYQPDADLADYHRAIYGIEKEYRLSKVAKVSAFMYGQQDINICYGDGLAQQHAAFPGIQDNSFDLLVANPPYSVRGFLETLPDADRAAYSLTQTIDKLDSNNSIEAFFIERAKQLLKAGGMAAVILPSSILSNGNNTYVRTREILLQYFDIVAIAELGSGTFGKTGTNTVTLFLRRKLTRPDTAEHYFERVQHWFGADINGPQYLDQHLIDLYAAHIGVPAADYRTLLQGDANGPWVPYLEPIYLNAFNASAEVKKLLTQKWFKALNESTRDVEMDQRYLAYVRAIERDKLLHFVLANQQPNRVLVIRSPSDTKAQKQFLGYDWSSAKGDEGIKLIKDKQGRHQTVLYDETDRNHPAKLNRLIAANFDGQLAAVPEELSEFARMSRLVDMLDFSKVAFDKQIGLTAKSTVSAFSRWPFKPLGIISELNPSKRELKAYSPDTMISFVEMSSVSEDGRITKQESRALSELLGGSYTYFANEDIILAKITPCMENGKCALARGLVNSLALGSSEFHVIRANQAIALPAYLFSFLNRAEIRVVAEKNMTGSSGHRRVPESFYADLKIPIPPLEIQKQIVAECEAVDADVATAQAACERAQQGIEQRVDAVYASAAPRREIDRISLNVQYGLSEKMNEAGVGYKIFRMNEIVQGRMFDGGAMKYADISADEFSKIKLNRGDLLFNRTNSIEHVGKTGLFDLDGDYCFASYLVRVVPDTNQVLPLFLAMMMNSRAFQQEAKGKASKSVNQANINATVMRNIQVPLPPLAEQQRFVSQVQELERGIATARATIAAAPARKQAILQRHL